MYRWKVGAELKVLFAMEGSIIHMRWNHTHKVVYHTVYHGIYHTVYYSIPQYTTVYYSILQYTTVYYSILQYITVYHSILQYILDYVSVIIVYITFYCSHSTQHFCGREKAIPKF